MPAAAQANVNMELVADGAVDEAKRGSMPITDEAFEQLRAYIHGLVSGGHDSVSSSARRSAITRKLVVNPFHLEQREVTALGAAVFSTDYRRKIIEVVLDGVKPTLGIETSVSFGDELKALLDEHAAAVPTVTENAKDEALRFYEDLEQAMNKLEAHARQATGTQTARHVAPSVIEILAEDERPRPSGGGIGGDVVAQGRTVEPGVVAVERLNK